MAKINVLDRSVYNLISAGEVVDKPMSVVKELVENSIDAKAKNIEVEVRNGGIDFIRVSDDGCGIEKSEIHKAFLPHATSKICNVDDLNSIFTLGFRGEALASIAAVAKVTVTTRTDDEELGITVVYDSGELISEYECGCKKGTTIIVENIFSKIPARQKFLRSAQSEEADISNLITRLILANPSICIKYYYGEKKIISTGENKKSAIIAVYGTDILSKVEEVSLSMPDITIDGFICKPSFSKHSRNYQTLIVNGRYVKNEELSYIVYLCYKDYLMARQYPMFALYIDIPADMVDVNVHPNKMEVKFVQLDKIKKLIKSLIDEKLRQIARLSKPISYEPEIKNEIASTKPRDSFEDKTIFNSKDNAGPTGTLKETHYPFTTMPQFFKISDIPKSHKPTQSQTQNNNINKEILPNIGIEIKTDNFLGDEEFLTVGTLFSTYIIVEKRNDCYLIDQHAAHERILYDKFIKQIDTEKNISQALLVPYKFELSYEESDSLDQNLNLFLQCGFDIQKTGQNEYCIKAVPALVSDMDFSKFLPIFFDAIKLNSLNKATIIKDVVAQSACKAAVKGDKLLSMSEIDYLIKQMNSLEALLCPHGRPIVVKITKYEIEKWFKRK